MDSGRGCWWSGFSCALVFWSMGLDFWGAAIKDQLLAILPIHYVFWGVQNTQI